MNFLTIRSTMFSKTIPSAFANMSAISRTVSAYVLHKNLMPMRALKALKSSLLIWLSESTYHFLILTTKN